MTDVERKIPSVSIGLPVYNGETYLRCAVDSLLAQTFTDFELIISDNASTDATREIAAGYASEDERVTYLRNERNEGAVANYEKVLRHARGELFKWAAHDDVCRESFLERCVDALRQDPDVVVAYPRTALIDGAGRVTGSERPRPLLESSDFALRLRDMTDLNTYVTPLFGVIRREVLQSVRAHGRFPGADRVLLVELALRGRFIEVDDVLFEFRVHENQYSSAHVTSQWKLVWWAGGENRRPMPANWRRLLELCRAVRAAPLTPIERARCYKELSRWTIRYGNRLAYDGWVIGRSVLPGAAAPPADSPRTG